MNKINSISLAKILKSDKNALAEALVSLETDPESKTTFQLLAKAYDNCRGHVIGVTGPPGVGKSTLLSELIKKNREQKNRTPSPLQKTTYPQNKVEHPVQITL